MDVKNELNKSKTSTQTELNGNYCWVCHQRWTESVSCTKCPRTFHSSCLSGTISEHFVCPECHRFESGKWMGKKPFSYYATKFIANLSTDICPNKNKNVANRMNKYVLTKNISRGKYDNPQMLLNDLQWLIFNTEICYGRQNQRTQQAKYFVKKCHEEIEDLDYCEECHPFYQPKTDIALTNLCNKKHVPALAKIRGWPFWPCKILYKINNDYARCSFFGLNDRAPVSISNIHKLSKINVKRRDYGKNKTLFNNAMEQFNTYIQNWEEKYEPLKYFPDNTPFVSKNLPNISLKYKFKKSTPTQNLQDIKTKDTLSPKNVASKHKVKKGAGFQSVRNKINQDKLNKCGNYEKSTPLQANDISVLHEQRESYMPIKIERNTEKQNEGSSSNESNQLVENSQNGVENSFQFSIVQPFETNEQTIQNSLEHNTSIEAEILTDLQNESNDQDNSQDDIIIIYDNLNDYQSGVDQHFLIKSPKKESTENSFQKEDEFARTMPILFPLQKQAARQIIPPPLPPSLSTLSIVLSNETSEPALKKRKVTPCDSSASQFQGMRGDTSDIPNDAEKFSFSLDQIESFTKSHLNNFSPSVNVQPTDPSSNDNDLGIKKLPRPPLNPFAISQLTHTPNNWSHLEETYQILDILYEKVNAGGFSSSDANSRPELIQALDTILRNIDATGKVLQQKKNEKKNIFKELEKKFRKALFDLIEFYNIKKSNEINKANLEYQKMLEQQIKETKKLTWCTVCKKQAKMNCCWNIHYCSRSCQQCNWDQHAPNCKNDRNFN